MESQRATVTGGQSLVVFPAVVTYVAQNVSSKVVQPVHRKAVSKKSVEHVFKVHSNLNSLLKTYLNKHV